jgi:rhamnulose-1-phosphate aldolase
MTKNITDLSFINDALAFFEKADRKGWHERNAGNLTYRLDRAEVESAIPYFNDSRHFALNVPENYIQNIAGEYFLATNAGSFIGNIPKNPTSTLSVVKIDDDAKGYTILIGDGKGIPTSELASHLIAHSIKQKTGKRVVYHSHPEHIVALTFRLPHTPEAFSNTLWRCNTECPMVFPEGIGVLPFHVPGSLTLALESARMLGEYNILIWAHHGVFSVGSSFDDTFSLVDVVEKAAKIYLLFSSGGEPVSTVSRQNILDECKQLGININDKLLV